MIQSKFTKIAPNIPGNKENILKKLKKIKGNSKNQNNGNTKH